MFKRLRRTLVESYIGAIALGWLFAQGIMHFALIFISPVAGWVARYEYRQIPDGLPTLANFPFQDALLESVRSFFLLLVWYVLVRWLYFKPLEKEATEPAPEPEQTT